MRLKGITLLVGALGFIVGSVTAGDDTSWLQRRHNCQPTMYSPLHYWAPGVYKIRGNLYPANQYLFPKNTTPCLQPGYQVYRFPCLEASPPVHPYGDPRNPLQ